MKCPKCSGALRLMSSGYYRNAIETPTSVSCINCGFYAEKVEPPVAEVVVTPKADYVYRPRNASTYGTYRSVIRDEIKRIREFKLKRMKWAEIIDVLAEDYPELIGVAPRAMQRAFGAIHGEFCEGKR